MKTVKKGDHAGIGGVHMHGGLNRADDPPRQA